MKIAFETKGFCALIDENGVSIDAKAGDTLLHGDATWAEIYGAYSRATGSVPKKIPLPTRVREEVV